MKALNSEEISGSWATLLLPVDEDDSINYASLAEEIDLLISMGVSGIYSNGTAGEFYNQTEEEFDRVSELLAGKCNAAGMPFQIGCSHMSPRISLERLKRAVALQPSAVQVVLPDWFPPTMPEIIDFLGRMAEAAAPVRLVLYNPPHAKKQLAPEGYREIVEAGIPLAGCKTAGGDENWYAAMRESVPGLSVFVPGHRLATGLTLGAKGAYSNIACLHPRAAREWYETMKTDMPSALELEKRILLFMERHIRPYITGRGYSNHSVDKFMAAVGGWAEIGTRLRWPYRWIPESEAERVREAGRGLLPEFFRDRPHE